MPKRTDIERILMLGAGPIVIGQACEFDYSGTQACKALRDDGYQVVLLNSNPATIMTDPEIADRTYVEPITLPVLEQILARERPDAVLTTLGGQTALNLAVSAAEAGMFERYGVEMLGADLATIQRAENREQFRSLMQSIGLAVPSAAIAHSLAEVEARVRDLGLPVVLRPSYTLGGAGGGNRPHPRAVARHRHARPGAFAEHRGAGREVGVRLEGVRAGADARRARQRGGDLLPSRTSTRWACTPAIRSPWRRRRP